MLPISQGSKTFGGNKMMVYKVSQDLTQPYSELTDLEKEVLKEKMVDSQLSSGIITTILEILRSEDLEIYDPQMVLLQELDNGDLYDNNGSKTLVAKYGDLDITADTLFGYMKENSLFVEKYRSKTLDEYVLLKKIINTKSIEAFDKQSRIATALEDSVAILAKHFGEFLPIINLTVEIQSCYTIPRSYWLVSINLLTNNG